MKKTKRAAEPPHRAERSGGSPADPAEPPAASGAREKRRAVETDEEELELPPIPPLEPEDETTGTPEGFTDLLTVFDDHQDLDDTDAADEVGIDPELPELEADASDPEAGFPLDVGMVLGDTGDDESFLNDEEPGTRDVEAGVLLVDPLEAPDQDGVDAPADVPELLSPSDWETLADESDGDEDAEDGPVDGTWLRLLAGSVTAAPEWSERPWREVSIPGRIPPCHALALADREVLAAGRSLLRVAGDGVASVVPVSGQTIVSLVAVPGEPAVVYATADGEIHRLDLHDESARRVEGWPPSPLAPIALTVMGRSIFARSSSGTLFQSSDGGWTWHRVALPGSAVTMALGDSRHLLIAEHDLRLHHFSPVERIWAPSDRLLPATLRREALLLADQDETVAVAETAAGLFVSRGVGSAFQHVSGCSNATALVCATVDGRPSILAALACGVEDRSYLVEVDLETATARRIADLAREPEADAEDAEEPFLIRALAWDPVDGRLFAAGAFGLTSWVPPRTR